MPKFRSRPREITANRFHGDKAHDVPGVCRGGPNCESMDLRSPTATARAHVHTMRNARVPLKDGDWVVPEPDGIHYYPIDSNVMVVNYEQLTDDKETEHAESTDR